MSGPVLWRLRAWEAEKQLWGLLTSLSTLSDAYCSSKIDAFTLRCSTNSEYTLYKKKIASFEILDLKMRRLAVLSYPASKVCVFIRERVVCGSSPNEKHKQKDTIAVRVHFLCCPTRSCIFWTFKISSLEQWERLRKKNCIIYRSDWNI